MSPLDAIILGVVEGLTEFLPISSTGHLILAARLLRLEGEAVKTFEVVIQAGALGAVVGLYRHQMILMWRGLCGRDAAGRALGLKLLASFLPAAAAGVVLHHAIKARLFSTWPVVAALAAGGVVMLVVDRARPTASTIGNVEAIPLRHALLIGMAQCLALWPGTSRSMVTIVAGLLLGLPPRVAADYSFLLALPTLGAATLFDAAREGTAVWTQLGGVSVVCGFLAAAIVAALAINGFLRYLTHRGLAPFGWYRIGLAAAVWLAAHHP